MRYLVPIFDLRRLPAMLSLAAIGALIAGLYGAMHDQVSYAISPEYFTRLKFPQFRWADFGLPERAHVSEIGFLATWWAGLFAGWFLARAGVDRLPRSGRAKTTVFAFAIVLCAAMLAGAACAVIGAWTTRRNVEAWGAWTWRLHLHDTRAFAIVAWLHAGGYVGALLGLVAAVLFVRTRVASMRPNAGDVAPGA